MPNNNVMYSTNESRFVCRRLCRTSVHEMANRNRTILRTYHDHFRFRHVRVADRSAPIATGVLESDRSNDQLMDALWRSAEEAVARGSRMSRQHARAGSDEHAAPIRAVHLPRDLVPGGCAVESDGAADESERVAGATGEDGGRGATPPPWRQTTELQGPTGGRGTLVVKPSNWIRIW